MPVILANEGDEKPAVDPQVELVLANAFDYLENSIAEIDKRPKYAVLSFATAVELLLKARLMREHWTLVLDKPGSVNDAAFRGGLFKSATVEEIMSRLTNVAGVAFSGDERAAYKAVRDHRNKVVHFFDPSYGKPLVGPESEALQAEQFRAWCHLLRRMKEWHELIADFKQRLWSIDGRLRQNWVFLRTKFEHVGPDLKKARKAGAVIGTCPDCEQKAAVLKGSTGPLQDYQCFVCERSKPRLVLACPECAKDFDVFPYAEGKCKCGDFDADVEWVGERLEEAFPQQRDEFGPNEIYCHECCHSGATVLRLPDGAYLCGSCLDQFDSVDDCEYCSTTYAGADLSDSYVLGCEMCEGVAAKDD